MATAKQKKAMQIFSEKLGKDGAKDLNMGEIMRKAGYSVETSLTPANLLKSKGWMELFEEDFPDNEVNALLKKLMKNSDPHVQLRAIENIFRIKGRYVNKVQIESSIIDQYSSITVDEE